MLVAIISIESYSPRQYIFTHKALYAALNMCSVYVHTTQLDGYKHTCTCTHTQPTTPKLCLKNGCSFYSESYAGVTGTIYQVCLCLTRCHFVVENWLTKAVGVMQEKLDLLVACTHTMSTNEQNGKVLWHFLSKKVELVTLPFKSYESGPSRVFFNLDKHKSLHTFGLCQLSESKHTVASILLHQETSEKLVQTTSKLGKYQNKGWKEKIGSFQADYTQIHNIILLML